MADLVFIRKTLNPKLQDAFMLQRLVYGNSEANPAIVSVPIQSNISNFGKISLWFFFDNLKMSYLTIDHPIHL